MTIKFKKWGSSVGVVIPKAIIKKYDIQLDKEYEIVEHEDSFTITEIENEPSLDELLKGMNRKSRYKQEERIQGSVGKEVFWKE